MGRLTDRITKLERKIKSLESKILDLTKKTEAKRKKPESRVAQIDLGGIGAPFSSTGTGLGRIWGKQANIPWNDSDGQMIPWGEQPPEPTIGINKHGHGRYSGGALDIHTLELVEYETNEEGIILDSEGNPLNKDCQAYWKNQPNIKKDGDVEKIGLLDIEFDPSSKKWVAGASMIDVEKTYLVQYIYKLDDVEVPVGTEGATKEIKKDGDGNEMKAPLLLSIFPPSGESESAKLTRENEMLNKSNVAWDKNSQCWRLYAVFKPYPEEEEEE